MPPNVVFTAITTAFFTFAHVPFDHYNDSKAKPEFHFTQPLQNYELHIATHETHVFPTAWHPSSSVTAWSGLLPTTRLIPPSWATNEEDRSDCLLCDYFSAIPVMIAAIILAILKWLWTVHEGVYWLVPDWFSVEVVTPNEQFFERYEQTRVLHERHSLTKQHRMTITYSRMDPVEWRWNTIDKEVDLNGRQVYQLTAPPGGPVYTQSVLTFEMDEELVTTKYRCTRDPAWSMVKTCRNTGPEHAEDNNVTVGFFHNIVNWRNRQ